MTTTTTTTTTAATTTAPATSATTTATPTAPATTATTTHRHVCRRTTTTHRTHRVHIQITLRARGSDHTDGLRHEFLHPLQLILLLRKLHPIRLKRKGDLIPRRLFPLHLRVFLALRLGQDHAHVADFVAQPVVFVLLPPQGRLGAEEALLRLPSPP